MTPHSNSVDLIIFATILVVIPFCHNNIFVTSTDTAPADGHGGGGGESAKEADTAAAAAAAVAAAAGKVSYPPLPEEGVAGEASAPLNLDQVTDSPVIPSTKSAAAIGAASTEATAADAAVEPTTTMDTSNYDNNNGTIPSVFGPNPLQNRGMIVRMTYVLVGFSILILVYFVVKAVRLRRMKSRTRKYGVLTENLNSPLGLDEDSEEEVEVFEVHGSNVRGGRANSKGGNTASDRLLP